MSANSMTVGSTQATLRRCHERRVRGGELIGRKDAIRAFVVDGREIPTMRRPWGTTATVLDGGQRTSWMMADGSVLHVEDTDMVTVVMDLSEAGYDVVGLRAAA